MKLAMNVVINNVHVQKALLKTVYHKLSKVLAPVYTQHANVFTYLITFSYSDISSRS